MKRVLKIFVLLSVIGIAALAASACCGDILPAEAAGTYNLYIVNNPSDPSLYRYSENGIDYYDIVGTLSDFVDNYYANYAQTESLNLFIGTEGDPIITTETLTISKHTVAEVYLQNVYASLLPPDSEATLASNSAIIMEGTAYLTINKGLITTDGSRAITHSSTGILIVRGAGNETVIQSSCTAKPTFGGTIYITYTESANMAYIQYGGIVVNSSESAYTSAILNYSGRDVFIIGGFVGSTPSDDPLGQNGTLGLGETTAIRNIFDGVVNIGGNAVVASANSAVYYMGVIHLSGASGGKETLIINGGSVINYNENSVLSGRCYTIYSINNNSINIADALIQNNSGYAIYNAGDSTVTSIYSQIETSNANVPAIYMQSGSLEVYDSNIYCESTYAAAIKSDGGDTLIVNSVIESQNSALGCVYIGSGDLNVTESSFINPSSVKVYSDAALNNLYFDSFSITGSLNVDIKIVSEASTIGSALNDFDIEAADNDYSDMFFRAWYENGAHYSDDKIIAASALPSGAVLSVHVEDVFAFIPDPDMENGYLFAHTPIKNFEGLTVELVFRPNNAYYLYEAYYFDDGAQKVAVYTHSGGDYTQTPFIEAAMPAGNKTLFAEFRPVPITVRLDDINNTFGDNNIRLYAVVNTYPGVDYYYSWYYEGSHIEGEINSSLILTEVSDSGAYSVEVSNDIPNGGTATDTATATISPKSVAVEWSSPKVFEYNGGDQYPTASALDLQGNGLSLIYWGTSHLVGRHTIWVTTLNQNYSLAGNITEYDIIPLQSTIQWSNLSFTYNGYQHRPTAYAEDVAGIPLEVTVQGSQSNAGTYTATAIVDDGSYVFVNSEQEFTISPAAVSVHWSFDYTDSNYSVFFYNGYDQLMGVHAYYNNIYGFRIDLAIEVQGALPSNTVFKDPDTYDATAVFAVTTTNYLLEADETQIQMYKAKPRITVPETNVVFVYDGASHAIAANVIYADAIIYLLDGMPTGNSFTAPGVYELTLTTTADSKHDAAPDVKVTVTVLATTLELKDEEGNIIASIYNAQGVNPDAGLFFGFNNSITAETNSNYNDFWGRNVLTLINLSAVDGNNAPSEVQGVSNVRIKLDAAVLSNKVLILRCLRDGKLKDVSYTLDEEGYIEFEADALGEYAIVGASEVNSIIGIAVFVALAVIIISALVIYLVRRKKSVF